MRRRGTVPTVVMLRSTCHKTGNPNRAFFVQNVLNNIGTCNKQSMFTCDCIAGRFLRWIVKVEHSSCHEIGYERYVFAFFLKTDPPANRTVFFFKSFYREAQTRTLFLDPTKCFFSIYSSTYIYSEIVLHMQFCSRQ